MAVKANQTITLYKSVDVSALTLYFKTVNAGSSAPAKPTTATPSGWSTTEPSFNSSKDLYATLKTTYSDSTFSYSNPQKYASYEAAKQAYNTATAAAANTVHQGTTPPSDTNKLWLDTNTGVNKIKKYLPDPGTAGTYSWQILNDYSGLAGSWQQWLDDWADEKEAIISAAQNIKGTALERLQQIISEHTIEQLDTETIMKFIQKTKIIEWADEEIKKSETAREKYIRFDIDGIALGEETSPFILHINNGDVLTGRPPSIDIQKDGQIISKWEDKKFTVPEMHIKDTPWKYKFAFVPHANGSLGFRKVVD